MTSFARNAVLAQVLAEQALLPDRKHRENIFLAATSTLESTYRQADALDQLTGTTRAVWLCELLSKDLQLGVRPRPENRASSLAISH